MKETEIGAAVVRWFHEQGPTWEVYQEVKVVNAICDVILVRGRLAWAVECKVGGLLRVIAQAERWRGWANLVSIAIPASGSGEKRVLERALNPLGLGAFMITRDSGEASAYVVACPPLNRVHHILGRYLHPAQKTHAPAGSRAGAAWTPFGHTVWQLREYVRKNPGCTMKDAVLHIKHHYVGDDRARSTLAHWIHQGLVPGLRVETTKINGRKYLTLHEASNGR